MKNLIYFLFFVMNFIYANNGSTLSFRPYNVNVPDYVIADLVKEIEISDISVEAIPYSSRIKLSFKGGPIVNGKEFLVWANNIEDKFIEVEFIMFTHVYSSGSPCTEEENYNIICRLKIKQDTGKLSVVNTNFEAWYYWSYDICHDTNPTNVAFGKYE